MSFMSERHCLECRFVREKSYLSGDSTFFCRFGQDIHVPVSELGGAVIGESGSFSDENIQPSSQPSICENFQAR